MRSQLKKTMNEDQNSQMPTSETTPELYEAPKASKWFGALIVIIALLGVAYYSGIWEKIASPDTTPSSNEEVPGVGVDDTSTTTSTGNNTNTSPATTSAVGAMKGTVPSDTPTANSVEKGKLEVFISAGVSGGAALISNPKQPNIEINKISLYNQAKGTWLVVYQGTRPLNLIDLSTKNEGHELILSAISSYTYSKVRLEYKELTPAQSGREATFEAVTKDIEQNITFAPKKTTQLEIRFAIDDHAHPVPMVITSTN